MNQKKKKHLSGKGNFPVAEEKLLCAMRTHMAVPRAACMRTWLHAVAWWCQRHRTQ